MFIKRRPCVGYGYGLRVDISRSLNGKENVPVLRVFIAIILIVSSVCFLVSCSASGDGVIDRARAESGTEAVNADSALLETVEKLLQQEETGGTGEAVEPVGRVEIVENDGANPNGNAALELDSKLTLLTPEGAIEADAIETKTVDNGDGTVALVLNANDAATFSSVNLEIRFDTSNFNPVKWAVGSMFDAGARLPGAMGAGRAGATDASGIGDKGILELGSPGSTTGGSTYLGAALRGANHLGIAVARLRPDLNGELSGCGELVRIIFERKPYANPCDERTASANEYEPPRTPQYFWDWDYGVVIPRGNGDNLTCAAIFSTQLPGDADGDLEVTVADITPVATNYLQTFNWYGGKIAYDPTDPKFPGLNAGTFLPDLDRDGEVGIPDITKIVENYGRKYDRFNLAYRKTGEDWQYAIMKLDNGDMHQNPNMNRIFDNSSSITLNRKCDAPYDADNYEYGLPYQLARTGSLDVLPFAVQNSELFRNDNYISSATCDSASGELTLTVDLLGDEDRSGEVSVADITPFANDFDYILRDDLGYFFPQKFHESFKALYVPQDEDDELNYLLTYGYSFITLIDFNWLLVIDNVELKYYVSLESNDPFRTEKRNINCFRLNYSEYLPNMMNINLDELFDSATTRAVRTMPTRFTEPVYVSVKLYYSDGTYSVWPERILVE